MSRPIARSISQASVAAVLLSTALLLGSTCATAETHIVHGGGGGMYETIQEGVDAAADGDVVLVLPGTYSGPGNEHIILFGGDITITSFGGPDVTIISDAYITDHGGAFYISTGTQYHAIIEGFTFRDLTAVRHNGGAIYSHNSVVTVRNCVFENCVATWDYYGGSGSGGAICLRGSQAARSTIEDCVFVECEALGGYSGVVCAWDQAVTLARCTFIDCCSDYARNTVRIVGSAVYGDMHSDVTECVFRGNTGGESNYTGILSIRGGSPTDASARNCTFVANSTPSAMLYLETGVTMERCIIAFNEGGSVYHKLIDPASGSSSHADITQCVVFGNSHGDSLGGDSVDNLFTDPLLCGYPNGDLSLCSNSPCLPDYNAWSELVGALDVGCGDCNSPVTPMTWGAIKALYR